MLSRSLLIACACGLGCWDFESLRLRSLDPDQSITPSKQTLRCDRNNYFTNLMVLRTKNYDPTAPYFQSEDPGQCQEFDTSARKQSDGYYNIRVTCPPLVILTDLTCTFVFGGKFVPQQFTVSVN
jgi:hypothetical protein